MMYVRFPLSLRQVEDLLHERGIEICHETERFCWNRFGPLFAANSHQPFRRREGIMARFRKIRTLKRFASVQASVHNHFNLERHLIRRSD